MRNSNEQEFETKYVFENVTVFGNVILNTKAEHTPDLETLDKEGIKINGR